MKHTVNGRGENSENQVCSFVVALVMAVPQYPPLARAARIQGVVQLKISIDPAGQVAEAILISGHKLLAESALTNVKTLRFRSLSGDRPLNVTVRYKYVVDDHLTEGNDCCRFKVDGPTTVEVYAGTMLRTD